MIVEADSTRSSRLQLPPGVAPIRSCKPISEKMGLPCSELLATMEAGSALEEDPAARGDVQIMVQTIASETLAVLPPGPRMRPEARHRADCPAGRGELGVPIPANGQSVLLLATAEAVGLQAVRLGP